MANHRPATALPWFAHTLGLGNPTIGRGYTFPIGTDAGAAAENAAYIAHAANAYPRLVAFVHNVKCAIAENGAEANLDNMLDDASALLSELGEDA